MIQDLKNSSHDSSVFSSPSKSSGENSPIKSAQENLPIRSSEEDSPAKSSEENSLNKSVEETLPTKSSEENSPKHLSEEDSAAATEGSEENSPAANSWKSIVRLLNHYLITWKKNYVRIYIYVYKLHINNCLIFLLKGEKVKNVLFQVPLFLVQKIFSQTFQCINVQLFNR